MSVLRVNRQQFRSFIVAGIVAAKNRLDPEDIVALMGVAENAHAARIGAYGPQLDPADLPVDHTEEEFYCPVAQAGVHGHDGAHIVAHHFDSCAVGLAKRKDMPFTNHVRVVEEP